MAVSLCSYLVCSLVFESVDKYLNRESNAKSYRSDCVKGALTRLGIDLRLFLVSIVAQAVEAFVNNVTREIAIS